MDEQRILTGIRVVELAGGIAGPVASMLLGAAGADVVKVEPPAGDPGRGTPGFATWNRSKRSVVLDLEDADGRARFDELLDGADVLVHDLSPAAARRAGLDDDTLGERYPGLVACAVGGYPIGHTEEELPASDVIVLARCGLMDEQAAVTRDGPTYLRIPLGSWGAAYLATVGVLARLIARLSTAQGGPVHTSLLQGALVPMTMHWARATKPSQMFALGMPKDVSLLPTMTPSMFECADGVWIHLMTCPDSTPLMKEIFAELGEEGVARLNTELGLTGPHRTCPNWGANVHAFRRHDSARWLKELWDNDVAVQPAVSMGQVFFDEQAQLNGYVLDVEDPDFGRVRQAGIPFTTTPPSDDVRPAPRLGEHTAAVLAERRERALPARGAAGRRWPLEGLKVLDFGMYLAGPIAPMMLADLGADVIKVEPPDGDHMRYVERTFAGCQRGKRGVAVDFKNPASGPFLERLAAWADVVHHNLRLPAARKLGLDYDSLRAVNPRLVYCHVSSYGPVGPRADWPGYDQLFQAASGWEYEGAGEGNQPMWHRFGMMDHQGGMASLVATLLGLYQRERTGEGQFVAGSLLGASVLTISETMVLPGGELAPYDRLDHDQVGVSPGRRIAQLQDGWIAVDACTPEELEALRGVAGTADVAAAAGALEQRTTADVLGALAAAGVSAVAVAMDQMEPFFDDPSTWASGLAARYPHAEWGDVEQIGGLWSFGDLGTRLDRASPVIGQHTVEVLTELGFTEPEVDGLFGSGAVTGPRG